MMLIKPHLAVLVPLVLLLEGVAGAAVRRNHGGEFWSAVTSAIYGFANWTDFLFGAGHVQAGMIEAGRSFFGYMSTSLVTGMLRLSDNPALAFGAQLMLGIAAIAMIVVASGVRWRRPTWRCSPRQRRSSSCPTRSITT